MPGTQNKLIKFIKNLKLEEITSDQLQKNKININSKVHRSILEAGLIGYLFESGFNMEIILHSDGAKEFVLFIHSLCWIHAARPIKGINASTEYEAKLIENALTKV